MLRFLLAILLLSCWIDASAQSRRALKLCAKGEAAMEKQQYVGATVHFTDALAFDPNFAKAQYLRAVSFRAIGQSDQAIKDFQQTVETDSTHLMAYVQLIPLLRQEGNCKQSIVYCDLLEKSLPDQKGAAHYHKALCYEITNNPVEAIANLEVAVQEFAIGGPNFAQLLEECKVKIAALRKL